MKNFLLSSLLLVLTCASFGAQTEVAVNDVVETEESKSKRLKAEKAEMEGLLIQRPDGTFMQVVLVEATQGVQRLVAESGVRSGICYVYVPHTTSGITINENFRPECGAGPSERAE